jgi:hypothetical protein
LLVNLLEQLIYFSNALQKLDPNALVPANLFWGIHSALSFIIIPVATAIAILRYRLYENGIIAPRFHSLVLFLNILNSE